MRPEEIKDLVEKNWVFSSENYPVLANVNRSQKRIFALNHILKHQVKGINFLLRGRREANDMRETIQKIIFNSIRFALLLDMSIEELKKADAEWNFPTDGNIASREMGGTYLDHHPYFLRYMKNLQLSVNYAFQLLEPCDHGVRLEKTKALKVAKEILGTSIGLAESAAIRKIEFYGWLADLSHKNGIT